MAKLRIPGALSKDLTINQIITKLKKAWQDIQQGKKKAKEWRMKELLAQAQAHADKNNTEAASELKNMIGRERTRRDWKHIGTVNQKKRKSTVIKAGLPIP